jgi:hypothetical protein
MRTLWGILRMLQVCWCPHTSELILCLTVFIFRLHYNQEELYFLKIPFGITTKEITLPPALSTIIVTAQYSKGSMLHLMWAWGSKEQEEAFWYYFVRLFWIVYLWPNVIYVVLCAYVLLGSICFTHSDSFAIERCNILGRYWNKNWHYHDDFVVCVSVVCRNYWW